MRAFLFALEISPMQFNRDYPGGLRLHSTVLHWFRTSATTHEVLRKAGGIIREAPPIELVAQGEDWFGASGGPQNILVNHVRPTPQFRMLHDTLRVAMEGLGAEHTEPTYVGDGFHPHVTRQKEGQFVEGSRHLAAATYLVQALNPHLLTHKRVIARIPHQG
jgi:2'-5' RNA ligase